jgi:hypothetical protein
MRKIQIHAAIWVSMVVWAMLWTTSTFAQRRAGSAEAPPKRSTQETATSPEVSSAQNSEPEWSMWYGVFASIKSDPRAGSNLFVRYAHRKTGQFMDYDLFYQFQNRYDKAIEVTYIVKYFKQGNGAQAEESRTEQLPVGESRIYQIAGRERIDGIQVVSADFVGANNTALLEALKDAIKKNDLATIKEIIGGKKLDANVVLWTRDNTQFKPLHLAIIYRLYENPPNVEIVQYLLEQGADPRSPFNSDGETLIQYAESMYEACKGMARDYPDSNWNYRGLLSSIYGPVVQLMKQHAK